MSWLRLTDPDIQDFIHANRDADVMDLALKKSPDASWPYALILDQIKVHQKAKRKSPDLYDTNGFIFPSSDTFEQTSSMACALYKSSLVSGGRFTDLTAGGGVDGFHFSKQFDVSVFVEKDCSTAEILAYNAKLISNKISVICADAHGYVQEMSGADLVFIDPQRRETGRKGLYDLSSCSPDIAALLPVLKSKAKNLILKASPFLDIDRAVESLGWVHQVHVIQWGGECKEVLYLLDFNQVIEQSSVEIKAVNLNAQGEVLQEFSYTAGEEKNAHTDFAMPQKYIYEPGPAFQKAGGFKAMATTYNVHKLHQHSHLYTSNRIEPRFPGKRYEVVDIVTAQSKSLDIKHADLCVRNFPSTVKNLKKKLKLKDGGSHRVFATTLMNNEKRLIICSK